MYTQENKQLHCLLGMDSSIHKYSRTLLILITIRVSV